MIASKPSGGFSTDEVRFGEYEGEDVLVKYASGAKDENNLLKGYRACEHISEAVDFKVPEPVKLVVKDNELLAIEEKVDTEYPSRQDWKNPDFFEQTVHRGVEILNDMHSDRLQCSIKESGLMVSEDRIEQSMTKNLDLLSSETNEDVYQLCREIISAIRENGFERNFSHNDFNVDNMIFESARLTGLFDWEKCGLADRTRDIALFESAIIDEYGMFFHRSKVESFREIVRHNINHSFSPRILRMYRFFQNAVAYSYISNGQCSETWRSIGTNKEIIRHRKKLIERRKQGIKEDVQAF